MQNHLSCILHPPPVMSPSLTIAQAMKKGGYCGREILQQAKTGDGGRWPGAAECQSSPGVRVPAWDGDAEVADKHLRMGGRQWRHHLPCKYKGFAFLLVPPPKWACSGAWRQIMDISPCSGRGPSSWGAVGALHVTGRVVCSPKQSICAGRFGSQPVVLNHHFCTPE